MTPILTTGMAESKSYMLKLTCCSGTSSVVSGHTKLNRSLVLEPKARLILAKPPLGPWPFSSSLGSRYE